MTISRAVALSKETESAQRSMIAAQARLWIGTPHAEGGDILGVGVDCGMLLVRCFVDTGLSERFDPRPYPPDWMMHSDGERYLSFMSDLCGVVDSPGIGDIVLFRFGRCYAHGGIVVSLNPVRIVHACARRGLVIEETLQENDDLMKPIRHPLFYSFWQEDMKAI